MMEPAKPLPTSGTPPTYLPGFGEPDDRMDVVRHDNESKAARTGFTKQVTKQLCSATPMGFAQAFFQATPHGHLAANAATLGISIKVELNPERVPSLNRRIRNPC